MYRIFAILIFATFCNLASGQLYLRGEVKNSNNEPLIGATVYIDGLLMGTVSDENGRFEFENLSSDEYELVFSYVGFSTLRKKLLLNSNREIEIVLEKSPYGLDEVIVKATRAGEKDPVAMEMITEEEIATRNMGQDIPDLLSLSPSLVSTSDAGNGIGYSGFRIRGTDGNRINITIDGIPLNDAESHSVFWVNMPDFASSVEDIQVQRGVGTSTNGAAAFGASVNFRTGNLSDKPYAETNSGFGSYNTWKSSNSVGTGIMDNGFSIDMRYSIINTDGYIDRAETSLHSMFISAGYYSEKSILKLNIISGDEKTYQSWDGIPSYILPFNRTYNGKGEYTNLNGEQEYYDNETDNYSQDHLQLHYTRELNEGLWLNASLHYTLGEGYYENYKTDEAFGDYGIPDLISGSELVEESDMIVQKWLDNDFYGGIISLNYKTDRLDTKLGWSLNRYDGDHFGEIIWARYSENIDNDFRWYESNGIKTDNTAFIKSNYGLTGAINLFGDLQLRKIDYQIDGIDDDLRDISQSHEFLFFNPKFGINVSPSNIHRAYASFGVANREPNRSNFVDADPNQAIPVEETLYDYEIGYVFTEKKIKSEFNFYYMDYDNQLVLTGEINDVGAPVMTNVKDSYRAGVEWSVQTRPFSIIDWAFNISLSSNKIKKMTSYVDNWDYWNDPDSEPYQYTEDLKETDIAFSPSIVAGSQLSVEAFEDFFIRLNSKYVGKQYIDNTSSEDRKLDPWFVNDLVFNYQFQTSFTKNISLNFMIVNLFDHEYESNAWVYRYYQGGEELRYDGFYPQAGIHFMTGIGIRF